MRITIDTKQDDPHHIRQAIALLQNILGHQAPAPSRNIFDNPAPVESSYAAAPAVPASSAPAPALFSMFDSSPAPSAPQPQPAAEESPQIELY